MRVLVACEYSGVVRRAFRERGHDAWSCDLLAAEDDGKFHYKTDIRNVIPLGWDLMIAHPPCTDIAVSGSRHFPEKRADGRQQAAVDFFMMLANAPIPKICIENPVCIMSSVWRKPDQIIQPYQFGHDASKKTCLWLKDLPKLLHTQYVLSSRLVNGKVLWSNQTPSGQNKLGPSPDRWKERSRTYEGIAKAMATQWSKDIAN